MAIENGKITTPSGIRLDYTKIGSGPETVIIPARLFLADRFKGLANAHRTLIFYDMRNRGYSDPVSDASSITIESDVSDLEVVREHFKAKKPVVIGFSYLGMMVIQYAIQHPGNISRIVQLSPLSRQPDSQFPKELMANDMDRIPDPKALKHLEELWSKGYAEQHPEEYCELEWKVEQSRMVGDQSYAERIASPCAMPNEWPSHLVPHFQALFASIRKLDLSTNKIAQIECPVLTIHGTMDRNAPYGGGREWVRVLPNARLMTIKGAAHMSWVEFPEVISAVDEFLGGVWPRNAKDKKDLEN